jgi:hypothetical protein
MAIAGTVRLVWAWWFQGGSVERAITRVNHIRVARLVASSARNVHPPRIASVGLVRIAGMFDGGACGLSSCVQIHGATLLSAAGLSIGGKFVAWPSPIQLLEFQRVASARRTFRSCIEREQFDECPRQVSIDRRLYPTAWPIWSAFRIMTIGTLGAADSAGMIGDKALPDPGSEP